MDKVEEILREHFEGSVVGVAAEVEDDDNQEETLAFWHGGWSRAMGLAFMAQSEIKRKSRRPDEEQEV